MIFILLISVHSIPFHSIPQLLHHITQIIKWNDYWTHCLCVFVFVFLLSNRIWSLEDCEYGWERETKYTSSSLWSFCCDHWYTFLSCTSHSHTHYQMITCTLSVIFYSFSKNVMSLCLADNIDCSDNKIWIFGGQSKFGLLNDTRALPLNEEKIFLQTTPSSVTSSIFATQNTQESDNSLPASFLYFFLLESLTRHERALFHRLFVCLCVCVCVV